MKELNSSRACGDKSLDEVMDYSATIVWPDDQCTDTDSTRSLVSASENTAGTIWAAFRRSLPNPARLLARVFWKFPYVVYARSEIKFGAT